MVSLYDRLGGNILRWSKMKGQHWGGATLPIHHDGSFYNVEMKVQLGWIMINLRFYIPFSSILVILGQFNDDNERLFAMESCFTVAKNSTTSMIGTWTASLVGHCLQDVIETM